MYLLGIDVETTGLQPKKGVILEIGAALFHVETKSILAQHSILIPDDTLDVNPVEHINKISIDSIKAVPRFIIEDSTNLLLKMFSIADAVIAHNAQFDRGWIEERSFLADLSKQKKWICTRYDIDWPNITSRKLAVIAAHLGVSLGDHHRALSDVNIMLNCLKSLSNFDEQLAMIMAHEKSSFTL